jgi:hypothetical protein
MISPRVVGLPSLPACERSITERVNESVKTGVLITFGLIRGPEAAPQAGAVVRVGTGAADAREGNADSDSVSNGAEEDGWYLGVEEETWSPRAGKGSGAPSS